MDTGLILIIMNVVLGVFAFFGFLFGLKGIKKAGLSMAFFIGGLIVTTLITPLITKLILNIELPIAAIAGENMSLSGLITKFVSESPMIQDLASAVGSLESFMLSAPMIFGNILVYEVLIILVGFIFKIAYWITAGILFKKQKKEENPVSKDAPANVSATGTVKYVANESKPSKHRWLGGLVGAVHGVILLVAFLLPAASLAGTLGNYMNQVNTDSVASVTLEMSAGSGAEATTEDDKYSPSAKLIRQYVPEQVVEIIDTLNGSIAFNVCRIVDFSDIWFNSLAQCNVNGERVVLKKEVVNVLEIYNNVEFLTTLDFTNVEQIQNIDFNKVKKAVDGVFNSAVLRTIAPEFITTVLDWSTKEDLSDLSAETREMIGQVRNVLDAQQNLKEYILKLKEMFADEDKIIRTLKNELYNVIDIAEVVLKSDLVNYIIPGEDHLEPNINDILAILKAPQKGQTDGPEYYIVDKVIDSIFNSDIINYGTLMGMNYGFDFLEDAIQQFMGDSYEAVIGHINLLKTESKFDPAVLKNIVHLSIDSYLDFSEIGEISSYADLVDTTAEVGEKSNKEKFVQFIEDASKNIGKVLDSLKTMGVFNELQKDENNQVIANSKIWENLMKTFDHFEITMGEGEGAQTIKLNDYLNLLDAINGNNKYFEDLFNRNETVDGEQVRKGLVNVIEILATNTIEVDGETYPVAMYIISGDFESLLDELDSDEVAMIVETLSSSEFTKPISEMIVKEINNQVKSSISNSGMEYELPENANIAEQSAEIAAVVQDAMDLMEVFNDIQDEHTDTTLASVFEDMLTEVAEPGERTTKETLVSLLENLEANATNHIGDNEEQQGVFAEIYDDMMDFIANDTDLNSNLAGSEYANVQDLLDAHTQDGNIDWSAVIDAYLAVIA